MPIVVNKRRYRRVAKVVGKNLSAVTAAGMPSAVRDKRICLMMIKLNLAAMADETATRLGSSVEPQAFAPPEGKIVAFDPSIWPPRFGPFAPVTDDWFGSRTQFPNIRIRRDNGIEALLAGSLNLIASKARVGMPRECVVEAGMNIVESGLSRAPSVFYPEAA